MDPLKTLKEKRDQIIRKIQRLFNSGKVYPEERDPTPAITCKVDGCVLLTLGDIRKAKRKARDPVVRLLASQYNFIQKMMKMGDPLEPHEVVMSVLTVARFSERHKDIFIREIQRKNLEIWRYFKLHHDVLKKEGIDWTKYDQGDDNDSS